MMPKFTQTVLFALLLSTLTPPDAAAALPAAVNGQPLPSLAPVLEQVTPAVVNIHTETRVQVSSPLLDDPFFRHFFNLPRVPRERVSTSLGSGVIVDAENGYILTNHHVIGDADDIAVTLADGNTHQATLIGSDPDTDIAVIKIEAEQLSALSLADSDQLRVGDFVVAVGNPFGLGQTVTSGIVSALGRSAMRGLAFQNFIQTDASINPGNSGGALINLAGELVGINTAIFTPSGGNVGIGFAIPSAMAQRVMNQLVNFGEVRRGTLGIEIQDLTAELAAAFGITSSSGVVVTQTWPDTAAARAGLRAGDVIISAGGKPIRHVQDLRNAEALVPIGDALSITYLRAGDEISTAITIAALESIVLKGEHLDRRLRGVSFAQSSNRNRRSETWVTVSEVERGSAGWDEGLRPDDVILAVNRHRVATLQELEDAYARAGQRNSTVVLQIQRGRSSYLVVIE
ncbi:MAG: Do family serine endopeptidase [Wenzhouxiangellaceae bacterium]